MRTAAIDFGTNSTRLLIVDSDGSDLVRRATVTRLGHGVDRTGELAGDAIARTVEALVDFRDQLDEHHVDTTLVRAVATSAVRDATNAERFLDESTRVLGLRPDVISGKEEGLLSWRGATSWREPRRTAYNEPELDLLIDIGGGSTEFILGTPGDDPVGVQSIDMGCIRITERFLHSDPPGPLELSDAVTVMHSYLDDVQREIPDITKATHLLGVAGSITTVAAIEIGLAVYDRDRIHQFVLTRAAVEDVFRTVATERARDRAANPGLHPDRVATIVGGALILAVVMRHFEFDTCVVSETDLLDAVVADLRKRAKL